MNIEGIKGKAEKEKLSWVRSSAIKTISETLGEVTVAIREYRSRENREMRGGIRRGGNILNIYKEKYFSFSACLYDLAVSSLKLSL